MLINFSLYVSYSNPVAAIVDVHYPGGEVKSTVANYIEEK